MIKNASDCAFFFDFDGTLVEFADRPEGVIVRPSLLDHLVRLRQVASGAVAIVTGRTIPEIDRFLAPLVLPVAGVHGLVRRTKDGRIIEDAVDRGQLAAITDDLLSFVKRHDGVLVEEKSHSVALHFRQAPHYEQACRKAMIEAVADVNGFHLQAGKCVLEARASGQDKGRAVSAFLAEPPFAGRLPVFVGDDATDENGFRVANAADGISVKVGDGETCAGRRLRNVAMVHEWIAGIAETSGTAGTSGVSNGPDA